MQRLPEVLMVVAILTGGSHIASAQNNCSVGAPTATPNFTDALDGSYTAIFEITDRIANKTYHVHETRQRKDGGGEDGWTVDVTAVHIRSDTSVQTLYYYDEQRSFVFYQDGVCQQSSERFPFDPWGWWDEDPEHGSTHYGPTAILRLANYVDAEKFTNVSEERNDILCDGWRACTGDNYVEVHYFYSAADVEMPDAPYFAKEDNAFPVHYSARKMDGTMHVEYNILEFVPFVIDHRYLETPRGADCENVTSLLHDLSVPSMPEHYSFHQESIDNSMIDGEQSGTQTLDHSKVYYSADLSLIRVDFIPFSADETVFQNQDVVKIIFDYNTGVQYLIDKINGNCSKTWLAGPTSHHHGLFGGSGEMVGPDKFLHLDQNFAYLGPYGDRHLEDHRWTATVHDVHDPVSGTTVNKLVVEWEFLLEVPDDVTRLTYGRSAPVRSDVFIYSNDDPDKITKTATANIYDYATIGVYTPEEFNVYECSEQRDFTVSYLVLLFKTDEQQYRAVQEVPNEVVHEVFRLVLRYGQVSPVRISNIDFTDGIAEPNTGNNETDTNLMLVSVRLLERAPYIYSYSKDDEASAVPGVNEKKINGIGSIEECAEFCSLNPDFDCMSFQVCDESDCYLSKTVDHDGDPVSGVTTCEHWVLELENITFTDLPSTEAFVAIRNAVFEDEFSLKLHVHEGGEEKEVYLNATEVYHYNNPDPTEVVSRQYSLNKRLYRLSKPKNTFDGVSTLLECESLCLNIQEYTCESLSYTWTTGDCRTASAHADAMSDSEFETYSHSAVLTRAYLTEYVPIPGRITLNSTGHVVYHNIYNAESCARLCSVESSIACRSFDLCLSGDCQLHEEAYLGPGAEGSYTSRSQCTHFSKASKSNFEKHSSQGLASDMHRLVLADTTSSTCAQLCLDDNDEVCESYDFCEMCQDADDKVCGDEAHGLVNVCFVSSKHLGEDSVTLQTAPNCQHYEREYFGDMTYVEWKNSLVRANDDPYGSGDMAGLAVGMIILGVLLAIGFLYMMAHPCNSKTPNLNVSFASLRSKTQE